AAAGRRAGDRIVRIDERAITDAAPAFEWVRAAVRDNAGVPMNWRVQRGSGTIDLVVTPRAITEGQRTFGRIEAVIGPLPQMVLVRYGAIDGLIKGVQRTWDMSALSLKMLGRIVIGQASLRNLNGPLTIADA